MGIYERVLGEQLTILYITNMQYPSNCGGGNHIYYIVKGLEEEGEEVYLITKNPSLPKKKLNVIDGLKIINVDWPKTIIKLPLGMSSAVVSYMLSLPSVVKAIYEIFRLIRKYDVKLIYERFSLPGGLGVLAGKLFGVPVVLEINDPYELDDSSIIYKKVKELNKKVQFKVARTIIVLSPTMERIIKQYTGTKIEIVPCGADTRLFKPMKIEEELINSLGIAGKQVITYMGSFRIYHGLKDLIEAYSILKRENNDIALLIIGGSGDSDSDEIRETIDKFQSVNDIIWVGELKRMEIPRYLSISDICVAPYNTSLDPLRKSAFSKYGLWGSPVKIFEYLAMGKVVVASCNGHIPEYVEGAGYVFKEGDVHEFADVLKKALSLGSKDRELMGMVGRHKVTEQFDWRILSEKTYQIIHEIIENDQIKQP